MEMPAELRRIPPRATLDWVAGCIGPGATVTRVQRLPNAWAAAMHAVDVDDNGDRHELVVRRWARTDPAPDAGVVENEAAALTMLASAPDPLAAPTELRVPRLIAADPSGASADVPALVMTRLPGRDVLAPDDLDAFLDGLVAMSRAVHAVPVAPGALRDYAPWGLDRRTDPPGWSRRPDVWRRAFEVARAAVPAHPRVLCHRDFHPGNVLWRHGRPTGVVDWTHACRGPAAADVAHCRLNLALLFGVDVADEFALRYGPLDHLAWFDVVDTVGCEAPEVWRWHDAGRTDITPEALVAATDEFLARAVDRVS